MDHEELCNTLSMTEIIRLQDMLSKALIRRFERKMALAFSDIVGSTPYFAKFGDEAGRMLQQRHFDLLQKGIGNVGRIVDTAGDGAFLCFPTVEAATESMMEVHRLISADNATSSRAKQLCVRIGIHFGPALTDGTEVAGDSVNFCSRVAASASPGEIRLTKDAFYAFTDSRLRLKCRVLPAIPLKGIEQPVEMMKLDWRDRSLFPTAIRLETGEEVPLPDQDIITFGRLKEHDGQPANDFVLQCADPNLTQQISRWHFELRRQNEGFVVRAVSDALTQVNGSAIAKGQEVSIRPGGVVRVGDVMSIFFLSGANDGPQTDDSTVMLKAITR